MKDLIILGNGIAGMTAALYAKRAGLDFKIVGRDELDFGQISEAVLVENYPCAGPMTGFELASNLYNQLAINKIQVEEHEIIEVSMANDYFQVKYNDGIDSAKTIIYALGANHKKLNCEIKDGVPIHYCALCDGNFYKNKNVTIIGGGDSAFTQAEYLARICKEVKIVMCDDNITAAGTVVERVKRIENIYIIENYPVDRIYKLEDGIHLFSEKVCGKNNFYSNYTIKTDGIFVAIGMNPNTNTLSTNLKEKGIISKQGYIFGIEDGRTPINGFFVAGDVRTKNVRQSITAAADGVNAVQSVINYLNDNKN